MMYSLTALVVAATTLSKLVVSQSINPTSVPIDTRDKWCTAQKASCPLLCLQLPNTTLATEVNNCYSDSLNYECVCSNGQSPNASQYSQTIPYFECTESANQCANNCGSNSACVTTCRTAHPCGAQDPVRVNTSTISTMAATASSTSGGAATTSGGSAVYTGFGTSSTSASKPGSTNNGQVLAVGFGRAYGLVVVLASVFGCFTFLL